MQGQLWNSTDNGEIDVVTILAIPLDHVTASQDYYTAVDATPADMSGGGTVSGASLTWTPGTASHNWLVWGVNQLLTDSTTVSYESYGNWTSGTPTTGERQNIFETPNNSYTGNPTAFVKSMMGVWSLAASSQTIAMGADLSAAGTGGESLEHSLIMAIDLDAVFKDYSVDFDDLATSVTSISTTDYGSQVNTVSITPAAVGPLLALGHGVLDNTGSANYFTARLQMDNSDINSGVTTAAMDLTANYAPVNDAAQIALVGFDPSASASSHTLDFDMGADSAGLDLDYGMLLAISLFEVSSTYNESGADTTKLTDTGAEVATLPTTGADITKLTDSAVSGLNIPTTSTDITDLSDTGVGAVIATGAGTESAKFGDTPIVHQRGPNSTLKITW